MADEEAVDKSLGTWKGEEGGERRKERKRKWRKEGEGRRTEGERGKGRGEGGERRRKRREEERPSRGARDKGKGEGERKGVPGAEPSPFGRKRRDAWVDKGGNTMDGLVRLNKGGRGSPGKSSNVECPEGSKGRDANLRENVGGDRAKCPEGDAEKASNNDSFGGEEVGRE